jgi:hypothetical protein
MRGSYLVIRTVDFDDVLSPCLICFGGLSRGYECGVI